MISNLLFNVLTTAEEGMDYLRRETQDQNQVFAALNHAAGMLEILTARKLAFRTYRDSFVPPFATVQTINSPILTGSLEGVVVGDLAVGGDLRPGSQVISASPSQVILNNPATAGGNAFITFGSDPELQDGRARQPWTWDRTDWPIYTREAPIGEVFLINSVDARTGDKRTLDVSQMRIEKDTGAIYLPNDMADVGKLTLEIHYSAGIRFPAADVIGHPEEAMIAQLATHRLAQVNFQDWRNSPGRSTEQTLGSMGRTALFDLPADIQRLVQLLSSPT